MTTRKPNKAQEMDMLRNELRNCKIILQGKVNKAKTVGLTEQDKQTADECVAFINKNAPIVKAFYA